MQIEEYESSFSDIGFWEKTINSAKEAGAGIIYIALVLYYTMKKPETPARIKMFAAGALGYFILMPDIIPDYLPLIGFTDDSGMIVAAILNASKYITAEIYKQAAEKLKRLFSREDVEAAVSALETKINFP